MRYPCRHDEHSLLSFFVFAKQRIRTIIGRIAAWNRSGGAVARNGSADAPSGSKATLQGNPGRICHYRRYSLWDSVPKVKRPTIWFTVTIDRDQLRLGIGSQSTTLVPAAIDTERFAEINRTGVLTARRYWAPWGIWHRQWHGQIERLRQGEQTHGATEGTVQPEVQGSRSGQVWNLAILAFGVLSAAPAAWAT